LGDEYGNVEGTNAADQSGDAAMSGGQSPNLAEDEVKDESRPTRMRESSEALLALHLYGFDEAVIYKSEKGSSKKRKFR